MYRLDYNHGTGHGVGAYLNVHEGPQRIGFRRMDGLEVGFYNGMTVALSLLYVCILLLLFDRVSDFK